VQVASAQRPSGAALSVALAASGAAPHDELVGLAHAPDAEHLDALVEAVQATEGPVVHAGSVRSDPAAPAGQELDR